MAIELTITHASLGFIGYIQLVAKIVLQKLDVLGNFVLLQIFERKRHLRGYDCSYCGKMFTDWSNRSRHIRVIHEQRFQYFCNICAKGMRDPKDLRGHMANKHGMQKDFKCNVCDKEYAYKSQLARHLSNHSLNDYLA